MAWTKESPNPNYWEKLSKYSKYHRPHQSGHTSIKTMTAAFHYYMATQKSIDYIL